MDFVTATVHPNNAAHLNLSETGLKTLLDTASIEIESIRKHLVVSLFDLQKQNELESLVQNYQLFLIKLLNDLFIYQQVPTENNSLSTLYISLIDLLGELLTYIEIYFSKYFNIDEEIPQIYYSVNDEEFKQQLGKLNNILKDRLVDGKLISIINSCYSFTNKELKKITITYRHIIYLKDLLAELASILSDVMQGDFNVLITNLLIYLNFNGPAFIVYMIDKFYLEMNAENSLQEKVLKLRFYKKEISQINSRTSHSFHQYLLPPKEQLLNWIEEEIDFLQNKSNIMKQAMNSDEKADLEYKINTSLSVPQLAYFIRLLVEGKTITNMNQTQLLKFFSSHFTSLKRENMSYGHLRSQYYKTELSAIESIRSLLLTLVTLSRRTM